jgi:Leucine-rich repeat (LRR) protein
MTESVQTRPLRRRILRLLLAVASVLLLLCAGGGWWWMSRPDFGNDVHAAGGRYRMGYWTTPLRRLSNWYYNQPTRAYHCIEFAPGGVDDEWLERHQTQVRDLTYLVLCLRETHVTDRGLSHLAGMANLQSLDLRGTQLSDAAMPHILGMPNLTTLDVARTGISDQAIARVSQMPSLASITLDGSQATQVAIGGLAQCRRLGSVMIVDASDENVGRLTQLKGLVSVDLDGDQLTTASLPHLKQLQGLQILTLWGSDFSDEDLSELRQALPGCVVQQLDSELLERKREAAWK